MSVRVDLLSAYNKARRTSYLNKADGVTVNVGNGGSVLETYVASREYNFIRSKGPIVSGVTLSTPTNANELSLYNSSILEYDDILDIFERERMEQRLDGGVFIQDFREELYTEVTVGRGKL